MTISIARVITASFIFLLMLALFGCKTGSNNSIGNSNKPQTLDQQVNQLQREKSIPALAFLTLKNDVPQVAVAGTLSVDSSQKLVASDLLPLGSDSKAITASLIARLVEQGKLNWNDKVSSFFPEFASAMDISYQNLTVEQLLRHESGLAPLTENSQIAELIGVIGDLTGDIPTDQQTIFRWAFATPARFTPGTKTEYGNLNYVVAGRIAEIAGQDTYENLVRREVFIPLGINAQNTIPKMGVAGHRWVDGKWQIKVVSLEDDYLNNQLAVAAGGWFMSMPDYAQFLKANIDGLRGHSAWLKESTLKYMHSQMRTEGFGIGWQIVSNNGETFSQHLGSDEESYLHGVIFSQKTGKASAFFTSGYSAAAVDAVSDFAVYLLQQ